MKRIVSLLLPLLLCCCKTAPDRSKAEKKLDKPIDTLTTELTEIPHCDSLVFGYKGDYIDDSIVKNPTGYFTLHGKTINYSVPNYSIAAYGSEVTFSFGTSSMNLYMPYQGFLIFRIDNLTLKNVGSAFKYYTETGECPGRTENNLVLIVNNRFQSLVSCVNVGKETDEEYTYYGKRAYLPCRYKGQIKLREVTFDLHDCEHCKPKFYSGTLPKDVSIENCYLIQDYKLRVSNRAKEDTVSVKTSFYHWNGSEGKLVRSRKGY